MGPFSWCSHWTITLADKLKKEFTNSVASKTAGEENVQCTKMLNIRVAESLLQFTLGVSYQLSWKRKLATVKSLQANVSSVSPSSEL